MSGILRTFVVAALVATIVPGGAGAEQRAPFDSRVLGRVPATDGDLFLEGIAFDGTDVYAGTFMDATATFVPAASPAASRIYSWNRTTGAANAPIVLGGEDLAREHGILGLTFDDTGRLYALSNQLGLVRFTRVPSGWIQERVAQLPDLAPCAVSAPPCSPTISDRAPLGNDLTFDADGNLYISDSYQATVWKVTPAGAISPWFQSPTIDRLYGPNGLRISPDGTFMALAITGPDSVAAGPVDRAARVIAIPFPDPNSGPAKDLLVLPASEFTDGIAYGERGDLYVLSNSANKVYILRIDGAVEVVENADLRGPGTMDFPAALVFDGRGALLITNLTWLDGRAYPDNRTVIDVWVNDRGLTTT